MSKKNLSATETGTYERVAIESLTPDPENANDHPEENIKVIMSSLKRWGQQKNIVVSREGIVVAGNGTLEAAKRLKWTEIDIRRSNLTAKELKAYAIADNASSKLSKWNDDILSKTLKELHDFDFPIDEMGFDIDRWQKTWKSENAIDETREDEVFEENVDLPITKYGDIWILGDHLIMCGDSTSEEDVASLLGGDNPDLVVTDPPYGVQYDAKWREKHANKLAPGTSRKDLVEADERIDWSKAFVLSNATVCYIWHANFYSDVVKQSLIEAGYELRQPLVWNKTIHALSRSHYQWKHEACWYAVKKGTKKTEWYGGRKQTTVWDAASPLHIMSGSKEERTPHPTQKPLSLYTRPLENHTKAGAILYDPFLGSGTALVAAEKLGRRCLGIDIEPKWIDVTIKRWQSLTGKTAFHADSRLPFGELERRKIG